jgi:UPF0271 protein
MQIDLNADLGESFGAYAFGNDPGLMRSISSASVAAGFHAGDPTVLRTTIRLAKASGVAVGAHPGFPDLVGFGRRELHVAPSDAEDFVLYQVAAVSGVAATEGLRLQHVKPHGALYNMAARDRPLAMAIARAVAAVDASLILFGPPGSELIAAAKALGLQSAAEAFADRAYRSDGSLAPRSEPGSVIHDPASVLDRTLRLLKNRTVVATDGKVLPIEADTLCLHGDSPGAAALAAALRSGLEAEGIAVRAFGNR